MDEFGQINEKGEQIQHKKIIELNRTAKRRINQAAQIENGKKALHFLIIQKWPSIKS